MKLYLLVEGVSSEMQAYPAWMSYYLPTLKQWRSFNEFNTADAGFYLVSGHGYPNIINHIENSVNDVISLADVDYLFIILDSDEDTVEARRAVVEQQLTQFNLPDRTKVQIVIQKRCFETILLGNRKAIPRQAENQPMVDYLRYYNVVEDDPELMGHFNADFTHAQFHADYAQKALRAKRIRYTKSTCGDVATAGFIAEIDKRIEQTEHLPGFAEFASTLKQIAVKMT